MPAQISAAKRAGMVHLQPALQAFRVEVSLICLPESKSSMQMEQLGLSMKSSALYWTTFCASRVPEGAALLDLKHPITQHEREDRVHPDGIDDHKRVENNGDRRVARYRVEQGWHLLVAVLRVVHHVKPDAHPRKIEERDEYVEKFNVQWSWCRGLILVVVFAHTPDHPPVHESLVDTENEYHGHPLDQIGVAPDLFFPRVVPTYYDPYEQAEQHRQEDN
eukprot:CAMPEP_0117606310 /NCGR_PEP_ID=MMETSP0784-20121206/79647_1 /TAXON_ID=39447 /ORGANISM="" /LENGTH=219 /DNA_ID=CAMNT_0005409389 /DNA_START=205 /DNA_END=863 /DNA_ORIENTATION=+